MRPALLLAVLGATLTLPRAKALICQFQTESSVYKAAELPRGWSFKEIPCMAGWGCQDTLVLIHNGPEVSLVLTKGCTLAEDQDVRITEHRSGAGLSVISYTHVCRTKNFCNNLTTTVPLWTPTVPTVAPAPGGKKCPICLSSSGCQETRTELPCPAGLTDCYDGVLVFNGGGIDTKLKVQGCMAQGGCTLLNGTKTIGPLSIRENCNPNDFLICHSGIMVNTYQRLSQEVVSWNSPGKRLCSIEEGCQETLLLLDSGSLEVKTGYTPLLVGSKGCSLPGTQNFQDISIYSKPPGMIFASYAHVCSSSFCNRAENSSSLLDALPHPGTPAPDGLRCPGCVNVFGSCSGDIITCPEGATHCYEGYISLRRGGISTTMNVKGCAAQNASKLLNNIQNIGIFSVSESINEEPIFISGVDSATCLGWVIGLGLSLALWYVGFYPPY